MMKLMVKSLIMSMAVMMVTGVLNADTTLRVHFNDTSSWDINPANGEYAAGTSGAILSGSGQSWATGFFPGSSPANKAFYATNTTPEVHYVGNDGNVPIYNPTNSVMTVGFWIKLVGDLGIRPIIIRSGGFEDYLMIDFGQNVAGQWTMIFKDDGVSQGYKTFSFNASAYITNWMYCSATVDLGAKTIRVLNYDNAGNLIANQTQSILVDSWDVTNGAARIEINYTGDGNEFWLDELTIDDRELSMSEMQVRVNKMVNGIELSDADSTGLPPHGVPPGPTNMTFRAHFNDNANMGWDINLDNDDFSGGDYTASWEGNPEWNTGFFSTPGASIPDNRAFYSTNSSDLLEFNGFDGNINYDSYTSGGITVGFWLKLENAGSGYMAAGLANIGLDSTLDHLAYDYGYGKGNQVRVIFYEGDTNRVDAFFAVSSDYVTNWIYLATAVDLSAQTMNIYQYDSAGNAIGAPVSKPIIVTSWDIKDDPASIIKLGGLVYSSDIQRTIDEFTIDNYVLTQAEIEARVTRMVVDGKELGDRPPPPPTGMFLVIK